MLRISKVSTDAQKGAVYGKCIAANYQNVSKDMCAKEFMALKDCYLVCHLSTTDMVVSNLFTESRREEKMNS